VDGDPGQLVAQYLALSSVQPGAHLDPQVGGLANNCLGTSNSPRRSVKCSEESIARRIDLATTIPIMRAASATAKQVSFQFGHSSKY